MARLPGFDPWKKYLDQLEEELHEDDETRVYYAIENDDATSLKQLLNDDVVHVNYKFRGSNQLDKSLLHLACEGGQYHCAKLLIERGANAQAEDAWEQTPLMYSICTGWDNLATLLLSSGVCNPNVKCRGGKSALHFAVNNDDVTCLRLLLAGGAFPNIRDEVGCTPLWHAMERATSMETVKMLVEAGCDTNIRDKREKRTPLQVAILRGKSNSEQYMKYLLEAGANPSVLDAYWQTPLMSVLWRNRRKGTVEEEDVRMIRHLIEAGSDVNIISHGEFWYQYAGTALNMAIERGSIIIVEELLKAGADPDIKAEGMAPALHTAVSQNFVAAGQLLVAAGCDLGLLADMLPSGAPLKINTTLGVRDYTKKLEPMTAFHASVLQQRWKFAAMLVTAGYDFRHDSYIWTNEDVPPELVQNFLFWGWIRDYHSTPFKLSFLCGQFIRRLLQRPILAQIELLPIPPGLKKTLMLKDVVRARDW